MKQRNPLSILWKIFSSISGVISLASFTDNLIAWQKFFNEIINTYKTVVYFPFKFFDLNFPNLLIDYLFIGSLCGVSYVRAISFGERNNILFTHGLPMVGRAFYFFLYLFFWPLGLIISLKQILFENENSSERKIKVNFVQWIGVLLFGFIIIVIINSLL